MMLVAKEFGALSPPAGAAAAARRWAPPSTARVSPRGGSPVGDLWLRTRGGREGPGRYNGSHESEIGLTMLVSDCLEYAAAAETRAPRPRPLRRQDHHVQASRIPERKRGALRCSLPLVLDPRVRTPGFSKRSMYWQLRPPCTREAPEVLRIRGGCLRVQMVGLRQDTWSQVIMSTLNISGFESSYGLPTNVT